MPAIQWSKILEVLPRIAVGFLPGIGGGFVKSAAGRIVGGRGAFTYPGMTSDFIVNDNMDFGGTETTIGGKKTILPAMNGSTMDRRTVNRVLAQTLADHNRAVENGTEKDLEEWWPGEDTSPRGGGVHPKSTAVKGIKIRDDGAIQIQWRGGGRWYTYKGGKDIRETTEKVKDLLTYPSIGRALAHGKGRANATYVWPNSKHLNGAGKVDPSIGKAGDANLSAWRDMNYEDDTSKWGNR